MAAFGRGCLYVIFGVIVIMLFAFFVGETIFIPWYILIPLLVFAFWLANRNGKK